MRLANRLGQLESELRSTIASAGARTATAKAELMESSAFFGETNPGASLIYYDDRGAPTMRGTIAGSARDWNNDLRNVKLVDAKDANRSPTLYYDEKFVDRRDVVGDVRVASRFVREPDGSGRIHLEFTEDPDPGRTSMTVPHETGHALGLADNVGGPCNELMAGGVFTESSDRVVACTLSNPSPSEIATVERYWQPDTPRTHGGVPLAIIEDEEARQREYQEALRWYRRAEQR
ncbi:MAG: snapalysin family zinc-dependent metalloprotease, partial [Nocardioides sp.]